jgi:hypothetical protein
MSVRYPVPQQSRPRTGLPGTWNTSLITSVAGDISGTADMAFGAGASTLTGSGALAGVAALAFGAGSSTLAGTGALAGAAPIAFTPAGDLTGTAAGSIAGTAAVAFGEGASALTGAGALAGVAAMTLDALLASAAATTGNNFAGPASSPSSGFTSRAKTKKSPSPRKTLPKRPKSSPARPSSASPAPAAQTPAITVEGPVSRETKREIRAAFRAEFNRDAGVVAAKALLRAQQEQEDEETLLWLI